jgi:hypothetical protein
MGQNNNIHLHEIWKLIHLLCKLYNEPVIFSIFKAFFFYFSPDLETCNEPNYIGKHRLSADAIWEATSLCHENAAFENSANHQTFTSMQI